eukprot:Polyplicarium_translucidae@DN3386_c0_g1_i4.p1
MPRCDGRQQTKRTSAGLDCVLKVRWCTERNVILVSNLGAGTLEFYDPRMTATGSAGFALLGGVELGSDSALLGACWHPSSGGRVVCAEGGKALLPFPLKDGVADEDKKAGAVMAFDADYNSPGKVRRMNSSSFSLPGGHATAFAVGQLGGDGAAVAAVATAHFEAVPVGSGVLDPVEAELGVPPPSFGVGGTERERRQERLRLAYGRGGSTCGVCVVRLP